MVHIWWVPLQKLTQPSQPAGFNGPNIRIPIIIPIKERGFINQGSGLSEWSQQGLLSRDTAP